MLFKTGVVVLLLGCALLAALPLALARAAGAPAGGGGDRGGSALGEPLTSVFGGLGVWGAGLRLPELDLELAGGSPGLLAGAGLLTGAAAAAGVAALLLGQVGGGSLGKLGGAEQGGLAQGPGGGVLGRGGWRSSGASPGGRGAALGLKGSPAARPGPAVVGDGVEAVPPHMVFETAREFFTWSADGTPAGSVCSITSTRSREGRGRARGKPQGARTGSQSSDGGGARRRQQGAWQRPPRRLQACREPPAAPRLGAARPRAAPRRVRAGSSVAAAGSLGRNTTERRDE